MQLVHKVLQCQVGQVDQAARTFWAVASTARVDRQGDSIAPEGWELANYRANPVIAWAHDYNQPPVAKALEVRVEGGCLVFQAQFAPAEDYAFADTVFRLYQGGYLSAFSVGFQPLESEVAVREADGRTLTGTRYLRQELYEISCVTLPANPEALSRLGAAGPHPSHSPQPAPAGAAADALVGLALDRLIAKRLGRRPGRII